MRLKKMKKGLLCLLLVFCMIAGDWIPVLATAPPAEQVVTEPPTEATTPETPEEIPGQTPEETPSETPGQAPEETPAETPVEAPEETPGQMPEDTPAEPPTETPSETPGQTPEETPAEPPTETPEETPGQTPEETPAETPVETPEEPEKENSDTENLLKEDEAEKETEEKTEEEIQEELPEEFLDSLVNTTMAQPLAEGDQSRAVGPVSKLEYTKKISKNGDGTYKLTLTVKAPEVDENILYVLDLSGSMGDGIIPLGDMVKETQNFLEHIGSKMGVAGFYGWAGPKRRSSKSIGFENNSIPNLRHGYEFPVYLSFKDWEDGARITQDDRPDLENENGDEYKIYNGITDNPDGYLNGYDGVDCPVEYRTIIPTNNSIKLKLKQANWMEGYESDEFFDYPLFYNTNWEAGFMAARNIIGYGANQIPNVTMVFITDGAPTVAVNGDLESGTLANVGSFEAAKRAETWRNWMINGNVIKRIISVFIDPSGNGTADPSLIGYAGLSRALTDPEKAELLTNGGYVTNGRDTIVSGSNGAHAAVSMLETFVLDKYFKNATIKDELSEYFEFASSPNVRKEKDGEVLADNMASVEVDEQNKIITMKIKDNPVASNKKYNDKNELISCERHYYLTPGATYSLSFDIKPTQAAYDYYADHNKVYPHKGDNDTDLVPSNIISSGKQGFYTNKPTSSVTGKFGNISYTEYYPMPVAQVQLQSLPVRKTWVEPSTTTTKPEVTIGLYRDNETTAYRTVTFPSGKYISKDMWFLDIPPGHRYTIKEITDLGVNKYRVDYLPSSFVVTEGSIALLEVTNTQLIPITIQKIWKTTETPTELKVGIGNTNGYTPSTDTVWVTLNASNNWTQMVRVPYKTSGTYYIKEYYNQPAEKTVTTTCERTYTNSTNTGAIATATEPCSVSTHNDRRYIELTPAELSKTTQITFTNQEQLSITVGKTWKAGPTAIPDELTISVDAYNATLRKSENWDNKTLTIPYEPGAAYIVQEVGLNSRAFSISASGTSEKNNLGNPVWNKTGTRITLNDDLMRSTKHIQFTNTENMSIDVEKEWVNYSYDSTLPTSLNVTLTKPVGSEIKSVSSSTNWTTSFTQIDYVTGGTYKIEEKNVPAGYEAYYTVYDTNGNIKKAETKGSSCTLTADEFSETGKVKFTNKELIKLSLEKKWIHPNGSSTSPINVTIMENGKAIETSPYILNASNNWKQDVSIPYKKNANYTISEVCPSGYTSKVTLHNGAGTLIVKEGTNVDNKNSVILNGTDFRDVKKVKFTNTKLLSLTVKKIWGTGVTPLNSLPVTLTVGDGEPYQLDLKGSSWQGTIENIKYDPSATYTLTENIQNNTYDISIAAKTGSSGTTVKTQRGALPWIQLDALQFGQTKYVEFTNKKTGSLTVTKQLNGTYASPEKDFEITVELLNADDTAVNYTKTIVYGSPAKTAEFIDGEATFSLKHGESITIRDVLPGYKYKVTEKSDAAYTTEYQVNDAAKTTSATGTITQDSLEQRVTVINTETRTPVTGILTDYSSPVMLLSISIIGVISYITLINKKKQKNHKI